MKSFVNAVSVGFVFGAAGGVADAVGAIATGANICLYSSCCFERISFNILRRNVLDFALDNSGLIFIFSVLFGLRPGFFFSGILNKSGLIDMVLRSSLIQN